MADAQHGLPARVMRGMRDVMRGFVGLRPAAEAAAGVEAAPVAAAPADAGAEAGQGRQDGDAGGARADADEKADADSDGMVSVDGVHFRGTLTADPPPPDMARVFAASAERLAATMARATEAATPYHLQLRRALPGPAFLLGRGDAGLAAADRYLSRLGRHLLSVPQSVAGPIKRNEHGALINALRAATDDDDTDLLLEEWSGEVHSIDDLRSRITRHCCGAPSSGAARLYRRVLAGVQAAPLASSTHVAASQLVQLLRRCHRAAPAVFAALLVVPSDLPDLLGKALPPMSRDRIRRLVGQRRQHSFSEVAISEALRVQVTGGAATIESAVADYKELLDYLEADRLTDLAAGKTAGGGGGGSGGGGKSKSAHTGASGQARSTKNGGGAVPAASVTTNATWASAMASPSTHRDLPQTGKGPRSSEARRRGRGEHAPAGAARSERSTMCVYCGVDGHEMWSCPQVERGQPPAEASPSHNAELFALRVRTRLVATVDKVAAKVAARGSSGVEQGGGAPGGPQGAGGATGAAYRVNVSLCDKWGDSLPAVELLLSDCAPSKATAQDVLAFPTLTVVDSASSAALLVNADYAAAAEWQSVDLDVAVSVTGVNGDRAAVGRAVHLLVAGTLMGTEPRAVLALVVADLAYPAILGMPLLRASGASFNFSTYAFLPASTASDDSTMRRDRRSPVPFIKAAAGGVHAVPQARAAVETEDGGAVPAAQQAHRTETAYTGSVPAYTTTVTDTTVSEQAEHEYEPAKARASVEEVLANIEVPLSTKQEARVRALYAKSAPLFVPNCKGLHRLPPTKLVLDPDHPPVACRPYDLSRHEQKMVEGHVRRLVSKGLATRTDIHCRWAAPAFVVAKVASPGSRLEDYRLVINYKNSVNSALLSDPYPSPNADDIIADLAGYAVYSSFDLRKAYDQCWLEAGPSREAAAFVCHMGTYKSNVVSLGLTTAPAIFARAIRAVIGDSFTPMAGVLRSFFDDVFAADDTVDAHLDKLEHLFDIFLHHNVQLSPGKEVWLRRSLPVLGRVCSAAGISPAPAMRCALAAAPRPTSSKVLASYLGLAAFMYRHAPGAAQLAARVRAAITRDSAGRRRLRWSADSAAAFAELQSRFADASTLAKPVSGERFYLFVDAMLSNDGGFGAVLVQREAVVGFASVCFGDDPAFANMAIREAEAGAMLWAHRVFERTIIGSPITVLSDSANLLAQLRHGPGADPRYRRLVEALAEYGSSYRYVDTEANLADLLSRVAPYLVGGARSSHPNVPLPPELLPQGQRRPAGDPLLHVPPPTEAERAALDRAAAAAERRRAEERDDSQLELSDADDDGAATVERDTTSTVAGRRAITVMAALAAEEALVAGDINVGAAPPLETDLRQRLAGLAREGPAGDWLDSQLDDDFCIGVRLALLLKSSGPTAAEKAEWAGRATVSVRTDTLALDRPLELFEVLRDGTLVVRKADSVDRAQRVVVPAARVAGVLVHLHGLAHRGAAACWADASAHFFWPGMRRDVEAFTRGCATCVSHRARRPARAGLLSYAALQATRPPTPWATVYCDTISLSRDGEFSHALVATCAETGLVEVLPIRAPAASEVVPWLFTEVVDRHAVRHLTTDGGPEFRNAMFAAAVAARAPGLVHVFSAPGHAAGNGPAERKVQWLRSACATLPSTASWAAALPDIRNSYNMSASEPAAGMAPFSLMTGRPVRPPPGAVADDAEASAVPQPGTAAALRAWASAWRREQAATRAAHFNKSRFLSQFIVGELVMRWKGERTPKLEARFDGPHRVVRLVRDGTYELEEVAVSQQPRRAPRRRLAHVTVLRRYSGSRRDAILLRAAADSNVPAASSENADADVQQRRQAAASEIELNLAAEVADAHPGAIENADTYNIDHIVGYSFSSDGELLFRVRWEGYTAASDTLEPYRNVHDNEVFRDWLETEFKQNRVQASRPQRRERRRRRQ